MRATHEKWLIELTSLPTAPGREQHIVAWVRGWAAKRKIDVRADKFGNLTIRRRGARRGGGAPVYITAHMDHPAFFVRRKLDERRVEAEFRGFVNEAFFVGTKVRVYHRGDLVGQPGVIRSYVKADKQRQDPVVTVEFSRPVKAERGDLMCWDLGPARVKGDRLWTRSCDDPLGVAAAVCAYDELLKVKNLKADVRLLFTRSEEIGFTGAIAALTGGTVPRNARLVLLESPKALAHAPVGEGPIVRVGDRMSIFDPGLTYRLGQIAQGIAKEDRSFKWQRKLMDGGGTEATAFGAYGYAAGCLCLAVGNNHNMNLETGRIEGEMVSLRDFHGLVRLLVATGRFLDDAKKTPALRPMLDKLFARRRHVLEE